MPQPMGRLVSRLIDAMFFSISIHYTVSPRGETFTFSEIADTGIEPVSDGYEPSFCTPAESSANCLYIFYYHNKWHIIYR